MAVVFTAPAPITNSIVEPPVLPPPVIEPLSIPPATAEAPPPAPIEQLLEGLEFPPGPPIDPEPGVVPAIDGAIFADLNGDGIQQVPAEPGMIDILVTLYLIDGIAPGEDALIDQVLTEERGIYYFGFLDNGRYQVEVDESPLPLDTVRTAPETNPSPPVEISLYERTPSMSFGYRQLCTIEGAVWHDADADGGLNEDTNLLGVNDVPVILEQHT